MTRGIIEVTRGPSNKLYLEGGDGELASAKGQKRWAPLMSLQVVGGTRHYGGP